MVEHRKSIKKLRGRVILLHILYRIQQTVSSSTQTSSEISQSDSFTELFLLKNQKSMQLKPGVEKKKKEKKIEASESKRE